VGAASLDDDDEEDDVDSTSESLFRFRFFLPTDPSNIVSSRCFSIINPPPTDGNDDDDDRPLIFDFIFVFIFDFNSSCLCRRPPDWKIIDNGGWVR
jgi:hypothetical protein